jgi:hypothetical protein
MRKSENFWAAGTLLAMAVIFSPPLLACVVGGSEGACYEQPVTLSGNCECSVTEKLGALVCRPKGVCDANDATSCKPNSPGVQAGINKALVIDSRFLEIVAAQNPLLASAVWGVLDKESSEEGVVVRTHLSPGEYSGTMGTHDHRSYIYHVTVRQPADSLFHLFVRLEEEGTGEVQEFDGALYERGAQGELSRLESGRGVPVAVWDLRPGHQRDRGASNSQ